MAGFNDWLDVTDPRLLAETIAERFRLSRNELTKAQAALAPAFALGLQRAMETPAAWSDVSKAFAAMMPAGDGSAPKGRAQADWTKGLPGQAFVEAVFGSDALAGAVARQASMMAGIAPDTIQKLMPSLAMLTMDTLMRATMAQMARNAPEGLATGDVGSATAEMMRRGANAVEALSHPSSGAPSTAGSFWARPAATSPFEAAAGAAMANPFTDAMTKAMTAGLSFMQTAPQAPEAPERADETPAQTFNPMLPFAAMFEAFAKGLSSAAETSTGAETRAGAASEKTPSPGAAAGLPGSGTAPASGTAMPAQASPAPPVSAPLLADGIVGDMVRSGQRLQEDYAKEMALLFERYPAPGRSA